MATRREFLAAAIAAPFVPVAVEATRVLLNPQQLADAQKFREPAADFVAFAVPGLKEIPKHTIFGPLYRIAYDRETKLWSSKCFPIDSPEWEAHQAQICKEKPDG